MYVPGYFLFLLPKDADFYQGRIDALADQFRGPLFFPHVTLLVSLMGDEDVLLEKLRSLTSLPAIQAPVLEVASEKLWNRCLYLKLQRTEALFETYKRSCAHFDGRTPDPDYMPHLSLLYGDYDDATIAQARKAAGEVPKSVTLDAVALVTGDGEPETWTVIEKVALPS